MFNDSSSMIDKCNLVIFIENTGSVIQSKRYINEDLDFNLQFDKEEDPLLRTKAINSFKTFEKEGKIIVQVFIYNFRASICTELFTRASKF